MNHILAHALLALPVLFIVVSLLAPPKFRPPERLKARQRRYFP